MGEKILKPCKKIVLEAPEGGWGYFICVAGILILTITGGFLSCFGILYEELITKLEIGSATVVLVTGANAMSCAISGFSTTPLLKLLSFRRLAFLASFLYNVGCLGIVFANSIITFFICLSLLQGFGFGILYNLTCTIINDYFVKKRFLIMGVIQGSIGILSLGIPLLVNETYNYYGYRGSLMIISAISMHLFVAVVLMQPAKWHMKKVLIPSNADEKKSLLHKDPNNEDDITIKVIDIDSISAAANKNIKDDMKQSPLTRKEDSAFMKIIKETFDTNLMKNFLPSYASVGVLMAIFADFVTTITLPQNLFAAKWSQEDTAFAMSIMSFGDLAARIVLIFFSKFITLQNKDLHLIGVVIAVIPRVGMLLTTHVLSVLVLLFIMGISKCFFFTLIPLIVGEAVSSEKFTAAMGMFMLLMGITNLSLGTAVGAVRDLTGSYDSIIWISIIILMVAIVRGLLETYCSKFRHTKKAQGKLNT